MMDATMEIIEKEIMLPIGVKPETISAAVAFYRSKAKGLPRAVLNDRVSQIRGSNRPLALARKLLGVLPDAGASPSCGTSLPAASAIDQSDITELEAQMVREVGWLDPEERNAIHRMRLAAARGDLPGYAKALKTLEFWKSHPVVTKAFREGERDLERKQSGEASSELPSP